MNNTHKLKKRFFTFFCLFCVFGFYLLYLVPTWDEDYVSASQRRLDPWIHNIPFPQSNKDSKSKELVSEDKSDVVCFVITLTGINPLKLKSKGLKPKPPSLNYFDGAAVLAKSIKLNFDYKYDLVAIVHENVKMDLTYLRVLGYKVMVVPTPITLDEIQLPAGQFLREEIVKSGCCGELELIKFEAYKLTQYSKIVLLDSDVLLTKPHALTQYIDKLDNGYELIFNFDRSMASTQAKNDCVSAGFLVFKPSVELYDFFIDTVKSGKFDSRGWNNSHMGWCYGGPTLQGLMAYYVYLNPEVSFESDSCRTNAIAFNVNKFNESCKTIDPKTLEMFHFSVCMKPWECVEPSTEICKFVTNLWWEYRNLLEDDFGLTKTNRKEICKNGKYMDITQNLSLIQHLIPN